MKYIFLTTFGLLILCSVAITLSFPEAQSEGAVIYWGTDPNPAREEQIERFHKWIEDNDYPEITLIWDSANRARQKKIIQGVSGVGSDVFDLRSGGDLRYFHSMGLLEDVTTPALEMGFDPSKTYAALEPELTYLGRQYAFPCNATAWQVWVNKEAFRRAGQPPPPDTWDFETFERLGKAYVEAANPPDQHRQYFFIDRLETRIMRRSVGLSVFNESLTRCTLDDPRYVRILERLLKWTYDDRILPSKAEQKSFDSETGYGGIRLALFVKGNYAMVTLGRYALIEFRRHGRMDLGLVNPPCDEFLNTWASTRAAGVYKGSKHKQAAYYFLKYLASESYNMQIVRDADALPPNPVYARTEAYLRPKDYPNEWGLHERFVEAAKTIAIGGSYSPFVLSQTSDLLIRNGEEAVLEQRDQPEEGARKMAGYINDEIERSLAENPKLKPLYQRSLKQQAEIEALRARGEKVPRRLIANPFHRRYYAFKGWLAEK